MKFTSSAASGSSQMTVVLPPESGVNQNWLNTTTSFLSLRRLLVEVRGGVKNGVF